MPKSIMEIVGEIVGGQSSQRTLTGAEIQSLVNETYQALKRIERLEMQGNQQVQGGAPGEVQAERRTIHPNQEQPTNAPAIDPQESIREDAIICLECGQEYRQLTHTHLQREHGLSPDEYRRKYGIPHQQPLAAISVTDRRKSHAKAEGIGEKLKAAREAARSSKQTMPTDKATGVSE